MSKGFGESQQNAFRAFEDTDRGSGEVTSRAKLKLGPGGRVVIPAAMREALGVSEGDVLIATLDGQELRLTTMLTALERSQAMVREVVPRGVRLDEELIADRRREVERESRG
jgi:AbrB family looped-hinge helix DNA binding protein